MHQGRLAITMTITAAMAAGCAMTPADEGDTATTDEALRHGHDALFVSWDDHGAVATYVEGGDLQGALDNPFFASLGTNGRSCVTCHAPSAGWTITPELARLRFTNPLDADDPRCLADPTRCPAERNPRRWGLDPLFRTVDGANAPTADVSTADARWDAYSLLLDKGLIRVGMPIPANAEFTLAAVDDPYRYASARELSLYRRPLPATNLRAPDGEGGDGPTLTAVMWDGRETFAHHDVTDALRAQANDATLGHAEAAHALTPAQEDEIVAFESRLHTAQLVDDRAGDLSRHGGRGGPVALAARPFYVGINDVIVGDARTGAPFDPAVFELYDQWKGSHDRDRARIARGEEIFEHRTFEIRGVKGLNDALGTPSITGTCSTCHDAPGYGHHSVPLPIDIGIADGARRTPDLPLYTLRNTKTGETIQTTDPGRALVTGKWADIGKFKGPVLRGLAARAPYFHNGSAEDLHAVVDFYDARFAIGLCDEDKRDLAAFLATL
jgi:hypothetical protein